MKDTFSGPDIEISAIFSVIRDFVYKGQNRFILECRLYLWSHLISVLQMHVIITYDSSRRLIRPT